MDFAPTEDQKMLAETVASFAKQSSPVERFRKLRDDEVGWERAVWKQMGELGWLSIPFPESIGGFGGSFVELSMLLEKLGTTLVPEPVIPSVALAGMAIVGAGDAEQRERFLAPLIAGDASLALAYTEPQARYDVSSLETRAEADGEGFRLSGRKTWVLNGHAADQLVVSARADAGPTLFVVDAGADGVDVRRVKTMDGHNAAFVTFDGATVGPDRVLGEPGSALPVLRHVVDHGATAACSEMMGIVQTMLDMTLGYLKEREQFGVKIGSFQALQHRAVDMFVEVQVARSLLTEAVGRVDEDDVPLREAAVSAAKAHFARGGRFVSQQAMQLHGGISITDEHDIGLYFKRMRVLNTLFGDEEHHVHRFASQPDFEERV